MSHWFGFGDFCLEVLNGFVYFSCLLLLCACVSRDSDLSSIISNLHHSRQHGMPEGQSASDHNASPGHTGRTSGDVACA